MPTYYTWHLGQQRIVIFSAPSGAGKTTILHAVLAQLPYLQFSISATTRPRRPHEVDGRDYYFITEEQFLHRIKHNEFLEWEEVYPGRFYGTLHSEVQRINASGHCVVFEVDVMGGIRLKEVFQQDALAIFINPPSVAVLRQRLRSRATESADEIERRLAKAEKELGMAAQFDLIVTNDELLSAVQRVSQAIVHFTGREAP